MLLLRAVEESDPSLILCTKSLPCSAPGLSPLLTDYLEQPFLSLGGIRQRLRHTSHSGLYLPIAIDYKHQQLKSRNHSHEMCNYRLRNQFYILHICILFVH